jgi:hypothetical protein
VGLLAGGEFWTPSGAVLMCKGHSTAGEIDCIYIATGRSPTRRWTAHDREAALNEDHVSVDLLEKEESWIHSAVA